MKEQFDRAKQHENIEQKNNAKNILGLVTYFQGRAEEVLRFEGNLLIKGDNVAEHTARLARLVLYISPQLKTEFSDQPTLVEDVLTTVMIHDDDEIIDGFDIPTTQKNHNAKDADEIRKFADSVASLDTETKTHLVSLFGSFRKKDTLAAKIAKVLDNITGNQVVIEQRLALINPNQARFAIEYLEKVRGVSRTTDALIDAQIEQVLESRKSMLHDQDFLKTVPENAVRLLEIDITDYQIDMDKINIPLEDL